MNCEWPRVIFDSGHGVGRERYRFLGELATEADSISIDGWDIENSQQQAYIRTINRHLEKTIDTDNDNKAAKTADAEGNGDGESKDKDKDEARENHGIIGCGIYYPWVTQTDEWIKALQKAEAATGYRASWHWNMERGDPAEPGKKLPKPEGWYDKIAIPHQKTYEARVPYVSKARHKSPEREHWEAERQQRFEETLKRHQKMFAELLKGK